MCSLILLPLLLMPVCAGADDVYHIRSLSQHDLLKMYQDVMLDSCRHAEKEWHVASFDSDAGHWGTGISGGNEGIRAIGEMILTSAALLKYSDLVNDRDKKDLMAHTTAALRYVVATHRTGAQKCTDGKQWGGDWQSAMWTGTFGFGAWLIWDELDLELQRDIERVVAWEADRFLAIKPPTGRWNDTKAEENGWTLICISLAANMFPSHAHAGEWRQKAIEYMMNTLSVPRDLKDDRLVDGRPVKKWVHGANLHPDFTLENHGMFHPSYVGCSSYFLGQAVMHYTYARRPVPQAATHHLMDVWQMFQAILLPCGESVFPQGMDWELHGLPYINLFAFLSAYMGDPTAAELENAHLQYIRAWQEMQNGNLAIPGSRLGFTRHAIFAEQVTYGYLAHQLFGKIKPGNTGRSAKELSYTRRFDPIGVILHRTRSKIATFSWKYRIMGMLAPAEAGHEGNPHLIVPITDGLVGSFVSGTADRKVVWCSSRRGQNGFRTTGELLINGGKVRQTLAVDSIGEKTLVYQDRVVALADISIEREMGVPVGIENDMLTGGRRTVHHREGATTFDWQDPRGLVSLPGSWANVDGRLGMVVLAGSGIAYSQASGYNAQAVYADVLYGSYSEGTRQVHEGEEVARRIVVLFTEVTPEETSALAQSVRVDGSVLRLRLPEGGESEIALM